MASAAAAAASHEASDGAVTATTDEAQVVQTLFRTLLSGATIVDTVQTASDQLTAAAETSSVELDKVVAQLTRTTDAYMRLQQASVASAGTLTSESALGSLESSGASADASARETARVDVEEMSSKMQGSLAIIEHLLQRLPQPGAGSDSRAESLSDAVSRLEAEAARLREALSAEAELAASQPPADYAALRQVLEEQQATFAGFLQRVEQDTLRNKERMAAASANAQQARDRAHRQLLELGAGAAPAPVAAAVPEGVQAAAGSVPPVAFEGRTAAVPIDVLRLVVFMTVNRTFARMETHGDETASDCLLQGASLFELLAAAIIADSCVSTEFADFEDAQTSVLSALACHGDDSNDAIKALFELLQRAGVASSGTLMLSSTACDQPAARELLQLLGTGTDTGRSGLPQAIIRWSTSRVWHQSTQEGVGEALPGEAEQVTIPETASPELQEAAAMADAAKAEAKAARNALEEAEAALEERKQLLRTLESQVPSGFVSKVHKDTAFWSAMAEDGVRRLEAELDIDALRTAAEAAAAGAAEADASMLATLSSEVAASAGRKSQIFVTPKDFNTMLDIAAAMELSRVGIRFRQGDLGSSFLEKDLAFTAESANSAPTSSAQVSTAFVAARAFQRILCTDLIRQAPATFNYLLGFDLTIKRGLLSDDIDQVFGCLVALAPASITEAQRAELPPSAAGANPAAAAESRGDAGEPVDSEGPRFSERRVILPAVDFASLVGPRPEIALAVWWGLGLHAQQWIRAAATGSPTVVGLAEFRRACSSASGSAELAALMLLREVFAPAHDRADTAARIASRFERLVETDVLPAGEAAVGAEHPAWSAPKLEGPSGSGSDSPKHRLEQAMDEDPADIMDRLPKEASFVEEEVEFFGGGCVPA